MNRFFLLLFFSRTSSSIRGSSLLYSVLYSMLTSLMSCSCVHSCYSCVVVALNLWTMSESSTKLSRKNVMKGTEMRDTSVRGSQRDYKKTMKQHTKWEERWVENGNPSRVIMAFCCSLERLHISLEMPLSSCEKRQMTKSIKREERTNTKQKNLPQK